MSAYLAGVKQAYIDVKLDERGYDDLMAGNKDSDIYRSIYGQTALGNYLGGGLAGALGGGILGAIGYEAHPERMRHAPALGAGLGALAGVGLGHMQRRRDADNAFSGLRTHLPFALAQALPYLGPQDEPAPEEKRAYGLKDVLGDALAAGTAGYRGAARHLYDDAATRFQNTGAAQEGLNAAQESTWRDFLSEDQNARRNGATPQSVNFSRRSPDGNYYLSATTDAVHAPEAYQRAMGAAFEAGSNRERHEQSSHDARRHRDNLVPSSAAALIGSAVPVGDHYLATPIATQLGSFGATALLKRLSPGAGATGHGLASAGGALAARATLRGFDTLRERAANKKAKPADANKE